MTTYNPNVPMNPSDELATTQPAFLSNFLQLYNTFKVDHTQINDVTDGGNHTVVHLLEQKNPPQTDVSEISVYTKSVDGQTDQIFLRYQGNGQEIQFTNYQLYEIKNIPDQTAFFTFLPGKIIVFFGSFTSLKNNTLTLFPPVAINIFGMSFCPRSATAVTTDFKCQVNLLPETGGVFSKILVKSTSSGAPPASSYVIFGNTK
jgi:hypothetical protein